MSTKEANEVQALPPHVERLILSKENGDDELFQEGYESGTLAVTDADGLEALELSRLLRFYQGKLDAGQWPHVLYCRDCEPANEQVAVAIFGDDEYSACCNGDWWERTTGYREPDPKFIEGFVEGALHAWNEAKRMAGGRLDD